MSYVYATSRTAAPALQGWVQGVVPLLGRLLRAARGVWIALFVATLADRKSVV